MAVLTIPGRPELSNYTQNIDFDGASYVCRFYFNTRDDFWYLDIADSSNEAIISGRKLTIETGVFLRNQDLRRPPGELLLFDTAGNQEEAGELDLGARVEMVYAELEDILAEAI